MTMIPDMSVRSSEKEIMDDYSGPVADLRQNLAELEIINRYLGGHKALTSAFDKLLDDGILYRDGSFTVADLGSGAGDNLRAVADWAETKGIHLTLVGIDYNQTMIDYAAERCRDYPSVSLQRQDVLSEEFADGSYDVVMCSLFCHHFTDGQLERLFSNIRRCTTRAFIINDLHRHWLAWYGIKLLTTLFSRSRLVKHDGPLSVRRAFKREELMALLNGAGHNQVLIHWIFAFRFRSISYLS